MRHHFPTCATISWAYTVLISRIFERRFFTSFPRGKKKPSSRESLARSLAWDSRALSPHMTLATCTRLPNAYNATPANGAICGKSLPSNLSISLSLTLLPHFYQSPLSPFLSFSLSPVRTCTSYSMHPLSLSIYLTPCQFHVFRIYTVRYFHLLLAIRFCCCFFSSLFLRKAISPRRISSTSLPAHVHF